METIKGNFKKIIVIIIFSVIILIGGFFIYTLDYYSADDFALQTLVSEEYNMESRKNITILWGNEGKNSDTAFIFYPGGKVQATAYAPLLAKLSQNGIISILVDMPFNLAVFNINAADHIYNEIPNIKNWYIGGHSLGGAMASSYIDKKDDKIKGLILLGAYPVHNVDMDTLAIFGTQDMILDKTKLNGTKNKLEIDGGNHAYFGDYGEQKGDGAAIITRNEQQEQTVEAIVKFVFQEDE